MEANDGDVTCVIPAWGTYEQYVPDLVAALRSELPHATLLVVGSDALRATLPLDVTLVNGSSTDSVGKARNRALPLVNTEWVSFFDADDLPAPDGYSGLLAEPVTQETVAVCGSAYAWSPSTSRQVNMGSRPRALRLQHHRLRFALACVVRNQYTVPGALLRTAAVRDAGGFSDLNYCEDWALGTALAFRGSVRITRTPVVAVRIHRGSNIHRNGTPGGILRALLPLHARWLRDPAVAWYVKPLLPLLAGQRVKQAALRFAQRRRSHDDLIANLGL